MAEQHRALTRIKAMDESFRQIAVGLQELRGIPMQYQAKDLENCKTLAVALELALSAIKSAPHGLLCRKRFGGLCNCWQAKARARITPLLDKLMEA